MDFFFCHFTVKKTSLPVPSVWISCLQYSVDYLNPEYHAVTAWLQSLLQKGNCGKTKTVPQKNHGQTMFKMTITSLQILRNNPAAFSLAVCENPQLIKSRGCWLLTIPLAEVWLAAKSPWKLYMPSLLRNYCLKHRLFLQINTKTWFETEQF